MKRLLTMLLALTLVMCVTVGCGEKSNEDKAKDAVSDVQDKGEDAAKDAEDAVGDALK